MPRTHVGLTAHNGAPKPLGPASKRVKPLQPWERRFSEWYAKQPAPPAKVRQLAKANEIVDTLAGSGDDSDDQPPRIEMVELDALKNRVAFQNHVKVMRAGGVKAAKRKLKDLLPEGVDAHRWAMEHAQSVGDYDAMAKFTTPLLRHLDDRKQATAVAAVQINISDKVAQIMETAPPQDVEVVEVEELEDDGA